MSITQTVGEKHKPTHSEKVFVKFIYSEKATKFCEIFTLLLTTVYTVKSRVKISHNFVAFSECMNFKGNWSMVVYSAID